MLDFRRTGLKPHLDGENVAWTVRMVDNSTCSILDRYDRAHDVKNFQVLDGASITS